MPGRTFWGVRLLRRIPEKRYKHVLSLLVLLICVLGVYMIIKVRVK